MRGKSRMARAEIEARGAPTADAASGRRRRRFKGRRRVTKKPSLIRRLGRAVWVSPGHAALALTTGLVCGALATRVRVPISPPYAAILGTLLLYPFMLAIYWRLHRPRGKR